MNNNILAKIKNILTGQNFEAPSLVYDSIAMNLLQPLLREYLPWSGAAMRPAAVCAVLNDIMLNDRKTIVEFGSGISTVLIARVLQRRGGTLISFDDDKLWQQKLLQEYLSQAVDSGAVQLVHAPLKTCADSIDGSLWYDNDIVCTSINDRTIDLCIVDGPSAYQPNQRLSRYPAIPTIKQFLNETYSIYLDDIGRDGERQIFEIWQRELEVTGSTFLDQGGFGLIRTGKTFFPVI